MGRRQAMTLERRNQAIGMLQGGMGVRAVSLHFGVSPSTISRLRDRFDETGSVQERPRSGRPRKTTDVEDRYVRVTSRRNRFLSAPKLANHLYTTSHVRVTPQTIRNRLHSSGIHGRRPYVGISLTRRHVELRMNWATAHRRWTQRQWNNVLFTDESRFCVDFADRRVRVWRRKGERFDANNVLQRDRYGGGSVMIWGGICKHGRTDIVVVRGILTSVRYCEEVINPVVVPFLRQRNGMLLQQDNARPHSARHTQETLRQNNIQTLDWPAKSPDLNPIEHLWDELGRRIRDRADVNNVNDLEAALREEWHNIPAQTINKLIGSMRKRCTAVIEANGMHNRY